VGSRLAVAAVVLLVLVAGADALRQRGGGSEPAAPVPPPAATPLPRTTLRAIVLADSNGTLTRADIERLRALCDEPRACGPIPNETGTDP
jgi:hypothetical protein